MSIERKISTSKSEYAEGTTYLSQFASELLEEISKVLYNTRDNFININKNYATNGVIKILKSLVNHKLFMNEINQDEKNYVFNLIEQLEYEFKKTN